jgi:hypothetical protein
LEEQDDNLTWGEEDILRKLTEAQKDIKEIQQKSRDQRDKGLKCRLEEEENLSRTSTNPNAPSKTAKKIEAILCSEQQQDTYTQIKQVFQERDVRGGLQRVDVPKRDSSRETQTTPDGTPLCCKSD